jgi:3',5'-cyclic-AMP phosphodiesterase
LSASSVPFTLVQLSDPHVGSLWSGDGSGVDDAAEALARALASVERTLGGAPDAVIVTGDIAHTGTDAEYELAKALLDGIGVPVHAIPGNHDDRAGLYRHFPLVGIESSEFGYAVPVGPLRLVGLDTTVPGSAHGALDGERVAWLDETLGEDGRAPTIVAMHHPPLLTGVPSLDAIGIDAVQRAAFGEAVAGHPQVQLIIAGHVHRTIVSSLGGATVLAIPSTDIQLALDLEADELRLVHEPPCFALHLFVEGRIVSHVQPV